MMKKLTATFLAAILSSFLIAPYTVRAETQPPAAAPAQIVDDYVTADGSVRAGFHKGKIYAVVTANRAPRVLLSPNKWTGDEEPKKWNDWLSDFDNNLFTNFSNADPGDGQQTVLVKIANQTISQTNGQYFPGAPADSDAAKFNAAIVAAVQKTLKDAPSMPVTKNPLQELDYALTFISGKAVIPFIGKEKLGFMAVLNDTGDNITVYGRLNNLGESPGIQVLSDKDGGSIDVTENDVFLKRVAKYSTP